MPSFLKLLLILTVFIFIDVSCKKNIGTNNEPPAFSEQIPDLSTKVITSASGFVIDENDEPVKGAPVKAGNLSTITDNEGYFEIKNVQLPENAAVVTVEYPGYFKGIKTFITRAGKTTFCRIKLLRKFIAGTIPALTGGSISLSSGLAISFPAAAVKVASTGLAYSGEVAVAVQWINPVANDLHNIMPGDLRGINSEGFLKLLTTYGMVAIELTGTLGELLQISDGKRATLTMPIPLSIAATAPASIPLWYFDEHTGLWKEEAIAIKTGNNYVGTVAHFSFWNCDVPQNFVQFHATLNDKDHMPIAFVPVKISMLNNSQNARWGYTDSSGYVSGAVPDNATLKLEVFASVLCTTPVYSQNFSTNNANYSAGTIVIPATVLHVAQISGTVTDCNNHPVTNGYVRMKIDNAFYNYHLDTNGAYNSSVMICSSPAPIRFFAVNIADALVSTEINSSLVPGVNSISNIQTCNALVFEYDGRYRLNGYHNRAPYNFPYTDIEMELWRVASNEVAFYWPEKNDFGHPIGVATNVTNWYGNGMAPVIAFDTLTNLVTDVYNSNAALPITMFTGAGAGISRLDPVTRTIYVYWNYNNNPDRAFFDTLLYTGPR